MARNLSNRYGDYCEVIEGKLYASVRVGGVKKRRRVDSKLEARQWALSQLEKEPAITEKGITTFHQLALWYEDRYLTAPEYDKDKKVSGLRTWKSQRRMLAGLVNIFGDYRLSELTVDALDRFKRKEQKLVSVTTVNRKFALMRTMFKRAVRRKWMAENPFDLEPDLFQIALENKRESKLTSELVDQLLTEAKNSQQPLLHYVLLVLAHTGARPSEIYPYEDNGDGVPREPLTWDRVVNHDFKAVELVSYKGRVRQTRFVPTSVELETGLRELYDKVKPQPTDRIFNITTFKRSWKTLCKSVKVTGVRMRDFRHYFNSYLVSRQDINDMERMLLLGHTELTTNARYSKLDMSIVDKFREGK